jgi:hypothetical protein
MGINIPTKYAYNVDQVLAGSLFCHFDKWLYVTLALPETIQIDQDTHQNK